jgi:adenine C2-methylase RlmN of 23S rRNA A2503 and tRNA A37
MRLVRNLTPGEIVGQVMLARDALGEWPKAGQADLVALTDDLVDDDGGYSPDGRLLTNIVMMGMGEPLYNFDNVKGALKLVMDGDGLALSKRRITLSTSGVVPMMAQCGEEIGVNLAVSLHAVTKEIRDEIVPINRKYGIEELLQACADYPGASNARRITFEYVMLKDKNDTDEHARELVRLIKHYKLPAKVNLIPFNPWPGAIYECSTPERIKRFSDIVFEAGISAPVRTRADATLTRPVASSKHRPRKCRAPNSTVWPKKSRPRWDRPCGGDPGWRLDDPTDMLALASRVGMVSANAKSAASAEKHSARRSWPRQFCAASPGRGGQTAARNRQAHA